MYMTMIQNHRNTTSFFKTTKKLRNKYTPYLMYGIRLRIDL